MPLSQDIAQRIASSERFLFLLGAGISEPAGIPIDAEAPDGIGWRIALSDTGNPDAARARFGPNPGLCDLLGVINKVRLHELLLQQNWQALGPTRAHEVLARLFLEGFRIELATVNYDPLMEKALRSFGIDVQVVCSRETLERFRAGFPAVFKIHGCPYTDANPESLLVTQADLASGRPWIRRMLGSRFQESHCVYVGFSGNAEYVLSDLREIANESHNPILSAYVVDVRDREEVFSPAAGTSLARFVQTLGIQRERYSNEGADRFLEEVCDKVARIILDEQLASAIEDASGVTRMEEQVRQITDLIRRTVLDHMSYTYAYDFVARLEAGLGGHRTLTGARDSIRAAFKWIIALIASGILPQASVAPVLAYPLRAAGDSPPVVIFAGDGYVHINKYAHDIEERYRSDPDFRRAIGCERDVTILAVALRCAGNPTEERGDLIPGTKGRLLDAGLRCFIWRSETQLHEKYERGPVASFV